jgi:diguanylate cyclase (GGDEF)-like protein
VLIEIARLITKQARSSDFICRYGGEEFLMVLPGATPDLAAKRAEDIRQTCAETIVQHAGENLSVTLSFGVAAYPEHGQTVEQIMTNADLALYTSKQTGRNRVTIWEEAKQAGA